jgi:hypothetical protein
MIVNKHFEQFNNAQHFEVHVTIFPTNDVDPFIKICNSFVDYASKFKKYKGIDLDNSNVVSCKPIIIVLPEGNYTQQPMCSTYIYGNLVQAVKYGELFSDFVLESHSEYKVSRNKVEARLRNVDDTINLDPKKEEFEGKYWEFHIKISFDINSSISKSINYKENNQGTSDEKELFEKHIQLFRSELMKKFPNCRLSKSALSNYDKIQTNICTRIVTLRIYSGTKTNALNNLNTLIEFLNSVNSKYSFEMRGDIEKELSVYDSNVKHDLGWISMIDINKNVVSKENFTKSYNSSYKKMLFSLAALLTIMCLVYYLNGDCKLL